MKKSTEIQKIIMLTRKLYYFYDFDLMRLLKNFQGHCQKFFFTSVPELGMTKSKNFSLFKNFSKQIRDVSETRAVVKGGFVLPRYTKK